MGPSPERSLRGGVQRRLRRVIGRRPDRYERYRDPDRTLLPGLMPVRRVDDREPALMVLLPGLRADRLTGGPNTAIALAARLAERGHRVRFVAAHEPGPVDERVFRVHATAILGRSLPSGIELDGGEDGRGIGIAPGDVFLATWWPTARSAAAALAASGTPEFIYLVQDWEAGFYPLSTNHALAASTYELPYRAIFNESLLARYFIDSAVGRFRAPDTVTWTSFEPAVDRTVFAPGERRSTGARTLLYYARPGNERNLFDLGIEALRAAVRDGVFDGDRWRFCSMGSSLPALPLGSGRSLEPIPWLSLEGYGRLLGSADVLLSLMLSPHTSYPPLEMAAAGGLTVTTIFGPKTAEALTRIAPSILGVEATVAGLVAGLRTVVAGRPDRELGRLDAPATWDAALEQVIGWTAQSIDELRGVNRPADPRGE